MVKPKKLSRQAIEAAPYEVWNSFVSIALSPYEGLDAVQRVGHHALWYESELNNGGHLQYFDNHGTSRIDEVIDALRLIGADSQARVLLKAVKRRLSKPRDRVDSVQGYVDTALAGEYDEFDHEFYGCKPEISDLLGQYLEQFESSFVERIDDAT